MVTRRKRRRSYKQYEARLIQLLRRRFKKANLKVDDHLKVGKLPLEIDLLVSHKSKKKLKNVASVPQLFEYFRRYNVLELKTEQTSLVPGDLLKLQAYAWLYIESIFQSTAPPASLSFVCWQESKTTDYGRTN